MEVKAGKQKSATFGVQLAVPVLDQQVDVRFSGLMNGSHVDIGSSVVAALENALGISGARLQFHARYTSDSKQLRRIVVCGALTFGEAVAAPEDIVVGMAGLQSSTLTLDQCAIGSGARVVGLINGKCGRFALSTDGRTVVQLLNSLAPGLGARVMGVAQLEQAALLFSKGCPEANLEDLHGLLDLPRGLDLQPAQVTLRPGLQLWATATAGPVLKQAASRLGVSDMAGHVAFSAHTDFAGELECNAALTVNGSFADLTKQVRVPSCGDEIADISHSMCTCLLFCDGWTAMPAEVVKQGHAGHNGDGESRRWSPRHEATPQAGQHRPVSRSQVHSAIAATYARDWRAQDSWGRWWWS